MKLSSESHISITSVIQEALGRYTSKNGASVITDIFLQPDLQSGQLSVFNDDDENMGTVSVPEWKGLTPENLYTDAEIVLKKVLNRLREEAYLDTLKIMKPYSFVLVDEQKETIADLMLVDDETLLLSGELLKGLDEELNAFLKDLMEK